MSEVSSFCRDMLRKKFLYELLFIIKTFPIRSGKNFWRHYRRPKCRSVLRTTRSMWLMSVDEILHLFPSIRRPFLSRCRQSRTAELPVFPFTSFRTVDDVGGVCCPNKIVSTPSCFQELSLVSVVTCFKSKTRGWRGFDSTDSLR